MAQQADEAIQFVQLASAIGEKIAGLLPFAKDKIIIPVVFVKDAESLLIMAVFFCLLM